MKKQNSGNDQSGDPNGNQQKFGVTSGISLAIIVFLLFGGLIFLAVHDYIPDNAKRAEVVLASMFSLAIVIVVVIQAGIYFRQAKALDVQMKIAGDALVIGNRSLISVSIESDIVNIRPICLYLENVGRVPAFEIDLVVQIVALADAEHVGEPNIRRNICESIEESYGPMHLQPGTPQLFLYIRLGKYLSDDEIALIVRQDMQLGIRGHVTWQDSFEGQPRQKTNFCLDYDRRSAYFPMANTSETEERWIPSDPRSWYEVIDRAIDAKRNKDEQEPN